MNRFLLSWGIICAMSGNANAVRVVSFEILLNGETVLTATTGDQGEDSDTVWRYLSRLCFQPPRDVDSIPAELIRGQASTLKGEVVLQARYGGRVVLSQLDLLPLDRQGQTGWRLHPREIWRTFPTRQVSDGSSLRRPLPLPPSADGLASRVVIAHRGASGYLPEHTPAAACLAYGLGADFVEQDVVLTRDGVPIVLHDIHLDTTTDVADRFPSRHRDDGRWYAIDFTWDEIQSLRVHERTGTRGAGAVFPARFPLNQSRFRLASLAEMIELIQGLNRSTGRLVGIYPELKQPAWHRAEGQDLTRIVLNVLEKYGYTSPRQRIFVQCFDADELKRIRDEFDCRLPLIQLVNGDDAGDAMWTPAGLKQIADYADGVGPDINRVFQVDASMTVHWDPTAMRVHEHGLVIHPYTLRRDALPPGVDSLTRLVELCVEADVDGFFSDFPDLTRVR